MSNEMTDGEWKGRVVESLTNIEEDVSEVKDRLNRHLSFCGKHTLDTAARLKAVEVTIETNRASIARIVGWFLGIGSIVVGGVIVGIMVWRLTNAHS